MGDRLWCAPCSKAASVCCFTRPNCEFAENWSGKPSMLLFWLCSFVLAAVFFCLVCCRSGSAALPRVFPVVNAAMRFVVVSHARYAPAQEAQGKLAKADREAPRDREKEKERRDREQRERDRARAELAASFETGKGWHPLAKVSCECGFASCEVFAACACVLTVRCCLVAFCRSLCSACLSPVDGPSSFHALPAFLLSEPFLLSVLFRRKRQSG